MDKKKLLGYAIEWTLLSGIHAVGIATGVLLCRHKSELKYKDKTLIKFY